MKTPDPWDDATPKVVRAMRIMAVVLLVIPLVVTAVVWLVGRSTQATIEVGVSFAIACWVIAGGIELTARSRRGDDVE